MKKRILIFAATIILAVVMLLPAALFMPNRYGTVVTFAAPAKKTGLYKTGGAWKFYLNGKFTKATGIAQKAKGNDKTWYYVKNGKLSKATTIATKADGSGKAKYYVKKGKLKKVTGDVKVGGKKYKLYKGRVQGSQWKSVYAKVLNKADLWTGYSFSNSSDIKNVVITDIGGNSIPELLFTRADDSISPYMVSLYVDVYTCINGKAKKLKSFKTVPPAAGYSAGLYKIKKGGICYKERFGDEYTDKVSYSTYSLSSGDKLKKTKKTTIQFKVPHAYDGTMTWHYLTEMYLNGKFYKNLKSNDAYTKAYTTEADSLAGFTKKVKAFMLGSNVTYYRENLTELGMTSAEAYRYLEN